MARVVVGVAAEALERIAAQPCQAKTLAPGQETCGGCVTCIARDAVERLKIFLREDTERLIADVEQIDPKNIVVVHIEVGEAPTDFVGRYLVMMKRTLVAVGLPESALIAPMRNGKRSLSMVSESEMEQYGWVRKDQKEG